MQEYTREEKQLNDIMAAKFVLAAFIIYCCFYFGENGRGQIIEASHQWHRSMPTAMDLK